MAFGNSSSPTSYSATDTGVLWMGNTGKLNFGLRPDKVRSNANPWEGPSASRSSVGTTASYNDGTWHHVVVTFDAVAGSRIFVDGALAAEDPTMTWSRSVNGYLRIGGDPTSGFTDAASSIYFAGSMDEVAFYKYPLSPTQAGAHADTPWRGSRPRPGSRRPATGPTTVDLTWRAVPGATGYTVARDGAHGGHGGHQRLHRHRPDRHDGLHVHGHRHVRRPSPVRPPTPVSATTSGPAAGLARQERPGVALRRLGQPGQRLEGQRRTTTRAGRPGRPSWATGRATRRPSSTPSCRTARPVACPPTSGRASPCRTVRSPTSLSLRFKLDDGAILYLNGAEVLRDNMPTGTVGPETKATTWAADDGQNWRTVHDPGLPARLRDERPRRRGASERPLEPRPHVGRRAHRQVRLSSTQRVRTGCRACPDV